MTDRGIAIFPSEAEFMLERIFGLHGRLAVPMP